MSQRVVVVTGSTGLLGHWVVQTLLDEGDVVRAVVRDVEKAREVFPAHDRLIFVVGDLDQPDSIIKSFEGATDVVHAAAYFREYGTAGDHRTTIFRRNVDATRQLAEAAIEMGLHRFLYVSSSTTVGARADGQPSNESDPPNPAMQTQLYVESKVQAEQALSRLNFGSTELITVLPGWMYGPGDRGPTGAGGIVKDVIKKGVIPMVAGDVEVADVRDVAYGLVRALKQGRAGERYLLAGRLLSTRELMETLLRESGHTGKPILMPGPVAIAVGTMLETLGRIFRFTSPIPVQNVRLLFGNPKLSSEKAERELGVTFRPFSDTARDTIAWFKTHS